jgi:putative Holliday junction resolvase
MEGVAPVASWIKTEEVAGLIIGWPVEMSGKVGSQCQKVLQFAEALSARVEKPFFLWDERLSTAATARSLKDVPLSRKKYAATLDKATAAHILQGALEFFRRRG